MNKQQLQYANATAIDALTDTANTLYKQVVPVWLIGETSEYYDAVVGALDGLRFIKINLDSGVFDVNTAFNFYKKQMDIINAI